MSRGTIAVVGIFVAVVAMLAFGREDPPAVFDTRAYAEAKKAAEAGEKWFIVKGTAVWCGPCKRMDKTTWRDEKVVKWAKDRAIVVAVDVDKEPKIAEELGIEAMPTMIAFKGGKEFDRVVGYKSAEELLGWFEGMARGEKSIEATKKRAGPKPERAGERADMRARLNLARDLHRDRKHEEAAEEYVWLWKNMLDHEPAMYGVRLSFMAGDMERLAKDSPEAKKKFLTLRDEAGKAMEREKVDSNDVADWVCLNKVVGDKGATLKWYDKVKDQKRWKAMVERVGRDLEDLLIAEKRWADLGRLYGEPMETLEREHEVVKMIAQHRGPLPEGIDERTRKEIEEQPIRSFRQKMGRIYAGLLAADRDKTAESFARRAMELDPKAGMAQGLVSAALEAGQAREAQVEWLEKAAQEEPAVKTTLQALLDELVEKRKGEKKDK